MSSVKDRSVAKLVEIAVVQLHESSDVPPVLLYPIIQQSQVIADSSLAGNCGTGLSFLQN